MRTATRKVLDFRCRPPLQPYAALFRIKRWLANRGAGAANLGVTTVTPSMTMVGRPGALEAWWKEIDDAGVTAVCASGQFVDGPGSIEADTLAELQHTYAGRFYGLVGVDLDKDILESIAVIEKAIKELGLRGIHLESDVRTTRGPAKADNTLLFPLYETMESLGAPVLWSARPFAGPDIAFTTGLSSIDRVLKIFPRLKIVVAHAGYPYVADVMAMAVTHPNLYICPDIYVGYARAARWGKNLSALPNQFVYASAYPFSSIKEPLVETLKLPIRDTVMEKYLWTNAARLLGLSEHGPEGIPERVQVESEPAATVMAHLHALTGDDVEAILEHYADAAVLLTHAGSYRGAVQLRQYFAEYLRTRPIELTTNFKILKHSVVGDTVYVLWKADPYIHFASDSYVVRDGKIVLQTWAARGEIV